MSDLGMAGFDPFGRDRVAFLAEQRAAFGIGSRASSHAILTTLDDPGPSPAFDLDALLRQLLDELKAQEDVHPLLGMRVETSSAVPPDTLVVLGGERSSMRRDRDVAVLNLSSNRVAYYNPWDRYGDPSKIERALYPVRGYTRHTLGGREAARMMRRRRRGAR